VDDKWKIALLGCNSVRTDLLTSAAQNVGITVISFDSTEVNINKLMLLEGVHCTICDFAHNPYNGIEVIKSIRAQLPNHPLMVVTQGWDAQAISMTVGYNLSEFVVVRENSIRTFERVIMKAQVHIQKQREGLKTKDDGVYRSLFTNSPDAIFRLGLDGSHQDCNTRAAEMLGYCADELRRKSLREIVAPEHHDTSVGILKLLLSREKVSPYERQFIRKDGSRVPVEISPSLVFNEAGQPQYIISMVRDISGRKRMQKQLEQISKQYQDLVSNLPVPIVVCQDDVLRYINPQACACLGIANSATYVGRECRSIVHGDDLVRLQTYQSSEASVTNTKPLRIRFLTSNGTPINVNYWQSIFEFNGKPATLMAFQPVLE